MYSTNTQFLSAVSNPNRVIDTRVTLKLPQSVVLTPDDIVSYKASYSSIAGKYFTPGNFVASTLQLTLNILSPTLSQTDFKNVSVESLFLEAGIHTDSMEYVPMGVFYVEKDGISIDDKGQAVIKATDLPPALSGKFDSGAFTLPCTVQELLGEISSALGIEVIAPGEDFPNLGVTVLETFELSSTYREALRCVAEVLGAFVCMTRDGKLSMRKIFNGVVDMGCVLDDNYLFSVNRQESTVKSFQYISIKAVADDIGVTQEVGGVSTDKEYAIINNPFTFGHPEDFLPGLIAPTSFTTFYPAKITFQGRPDIDLGDVLEYAYKGVTYKLPVSSHVFEYNGGFKTTVESIGTDSLEVSSTNGNLLSTEITALKQNINSLVRDLSHTQSEITSINGDVIKLSSLLQTVDKIQSQVSSISGGIEQLTTLTQAQDQLRIDIQTVSKGLDDANAAIDQNQANLLTYFDFQSEGLTIGANTSNIKLRLANNKIQFLKDGSEVAHMSEGQLYVTDAHFLKSLVLGNFEFTPRNNGNLSLRRR